MYLYVYVLGYGPRHVSLFVLFRIMVMLYTLASNRGGVLVISRITVYALSYAMYM